MPVPRETSRVIVLDPTGRVLLLGYVLPNQKRTVWVAPGGTQELLEDAAAAALRELAEETEMTISRDRLGPAVATCAGCWTSSDGLVYEARDTYFAIQVEAFMPTSSGFTPSEHEQVQHVRWWTPEEIEATADMVFPAGPAMLIRRLAGGDYPSEPISLPWS